MIAWTDAEDISWPKVANEGGEAAFLETVILCYVTNSYSCDADHMNPNH